MKSRLVKKSQMYERTHDHGFGNNAYLYSISGEFLGICKHDPSVLLAAVIKNPNIGYYTYMMEKHYVTLIKETAAKMYNTYEYYEMNNADIWWVKKNFKEVYARETARAKYHKWHVIKIHDRYNRLVFDEKTHTFIQLHIIPKGFKLTLTHAPSEWWHNISAYRKLTTTITLVDMGIFEFPRFICDTDMRKRETGYLTMPHTNSHQNCFKTTHVGIVIKKLEEKGFVFEHNPLYKTAVSIYEASK